jgi:hypothetical protein
VDTGPPRQGHTRAQDAPRRTRRSRLGDHDYPYGSTGDWSDHVAFRKAGIPYLYLEATNWLLGKKDRDLNTAKDHKIWHTGKDTLSYIEQRYPGRLQTQLESKSAALAAFLTEYTPDD